MIRPFNDSDQDYEHVADIWNAAYPDHKGTADEIKQDDAARPEKITMRRFMLEPEQSPIGFGVFVNRQWAYQPDEFAMTLVVRPEFHGQGYGKALYEHVLCELEPFKPTKLFSWAREDRARPMRFLEDRGFKEVMRSFESRLDVKAFDPEPYRGLEPKLTQEGILLKSVAELKDDPEHERKIYELHCTLDQDVPMVGEFTKPDFETFCKAHFLHERFLPEGFLVATHGDAYIGMSELFTSKADDRLHTGLTGVLREYRRKGVALALKVKAAEFARDYGAPEISTWNASNNRPMLSINERLGFVKQPASIDFEKVL